MFADIGGARWAGLLLAALLAGCGDDPVGADSGGPATDLAARAGEPSLSWLTVDDVRSPTFWLIERSSGRDLVGDDPRVAILDARLAAAGAIFHESPRMLANRAAQLTDVSAEQGEPILPEQVLADLTFPIKGETRSWFGVLAQSYIVLRQGGSSHAQAVDHLRNQYEASSP